MWPACRGPADPQQRESETSQSSILKSFFRADEVELQLHINGVSGSLRKAVFGETSRAEEMPRKRKEGGGVQDEEAEKQALERKREAARVHARNTRKRKREYIERLQATHNE